MRAAALTALLLFLALLGANELLAARESAGEDSGPVAVDVDAAREALAVRLLEAEAACARAADEALVAATDRTEPAALFAALEDVPLPAGAGVHLFDRYGRMLAWTGGSLRDSALRALPTDRDGGIFAETATGRRMAVRRQRSSPLEGVAIVAVAHVPIEQRFPVRSPFLRSTSLAGEVESAFRVGNIEILPPGTERGVALPSAFGGVLAQLVVPPLSPEVWNEIVEDDAAARRSLLVAVAAAVALLLALAAAPRIAGGRPGGTWLVRCAVVVLMRVVVALAEPQAALDGSALVDPGVYAGGWPLGLNDSPLALLLTSLAFVSVAGFVDAAAATAARRPLPTALFAVIVTGGALAGRGLLAWLVRDVVANSAVRFLPDDAVLPPPGPAVLFVALVAAGAGVLALLDALWRIAAPEPLRTPTGRVLSAVVLAAVVAPLGTGTAPLRPWLLVSGVAGFLAALGAALHGRGVATRAAVVPLGLSLGLFAPLQHRLDEALRDDLEFVADERMEVGESVREEAEILFVERVLEEIAGNDELREALGGRRLPSDLAARLWSRSSLSQRTEASGLELLPIEAEVEYQTFSADMPPRTWLPDPRDLPGPDTSWVVTRDGRGLGADSRWVVGETPIEIAGGRPLSVRVWLELQPAVTARILDLAERDSFGSTGSRTPRRPTVDRYGADGALVAGAAENPFTPLGSRLEPYLAEDVLDEGRRAWRTVQVAGATFLILVVPVEEGDEREALAFSTDVASPRDLLLRATKAALVGALLAALSVVLTAPWWAGRARLRLAHRLVLSYVLVSALPLLILAWANRELVQERDQNERRRELRESVSTLAAALHQPAVASSLAEIEVAELERLGPRVSQLSNVAYSPGRRENVYIGARLVASTDQGLLDTDLLPTRMPGQAYDEIVLQGRAFYAQTVRAGGHPVDVAYAPLRNAESPENEVIGAVSVAMVREGAGRDREQANAVTTVLGFYLASLVAAMAAGSFLAERLTSPLRALRQATRRVATGDLSEPVPGAGPGELGQVVEAFNVMTRDLAESREKLVRAEKEAAWRDMARQVAHEVKNPLTPMRLAAEHLRRAHRDGSPQFERILERSVDVIIRQTENLRRIVTDFRDFARMPVQRREPVAVGPALLEALDLFRGVPGLTIDVTVDDDLPETLADPDEMRRVLVNVVGNAVEALAGGDGTIRARAVRDGEHVVVTLADDGPGIPAEALPRLFEPSFSTKTGGTGLGLAICKRAVEDLGGTIDLASAAGEGTTVTIRLPASA